MRNMFFKKRLALHGRSASKRQALMVEALERRDLMAVTPVLHLQSHISEYLEDPIPGTLAPDARIVDDNLIFGGGQLKLQITENASTWDYVGIKPTGSGPGQVDMVADEVQYEGQTVADFEMRKPISGTPYVYKTVGGVQLKIYMIQPPATFTGPRPAILLVHGGGWSIGGPGALNERGEYWASRGMVAALVEYRLVPIDNNDPPVPCLQDVKSAMRWLRSNAEQFNIDPTRIAAGGGSAGGHLAAAAGMIEATNDPSDDMSISAKPNALVLSYPQINNGPGNWGYGRVGDLYPQLSPYHNISNDDPPTIAFFGELDPQIPQPIVEAFRVKMQDEGVRLDLHIYEGQFHGFDTYAWDNQFFYSVMQLSDKFLGPVAQGGLGWLEGEPTISMPTEPPTPDPWISKSTITFNDNATAAAVQAVLRSLALTVTDDPGTAARKITWQFTDADGNASNVTGKLVTTVPVNDPPKVNLFGLARYVEHAPPFILAPTTILEDPDTKALFGGHVTVTIKGVQDPNDRLEIISVGDGPHQVRIAGGFAYYEGQQVAQVSGGTAASPLFIKLLNGPPSEVVQAIVRNIQFRSIGDNPMPGERQVTYVATDGEGGISLPAIKYVQVIPTNDPPKLNNSGNPVLNWIYEDTAQPVGTEVARLVNGIMTDIDGNGIRGVAVSSLVGSDRGSWQYTLDNGATWKPIGPVSDKAARLIPVTASSRIRFVPNANFEGQVRLYYRAWDQKQGLAGGTFNLLSPGAQGKFSAFSSAYESATLAVRPQNDSPLLNNTGNPQLNWIYQGTAQPVGTLVKQFTQGLIRDPDRNALQGIALTWAGGTDNGRWQFSLSGGQAWTDLATLSTKAAMLLPADDLTRVRFIPKPGFTGQVRISFKAWDRTWGNSGDMVNTESRTGPFSPYSKAIESASLTVRPAAQSAAVPSPTLSGPTSPLGYQLNSSTPVWFMAAATMQSGATHVGGGKLHLRVASGAAASNRIEFGGGVTYNGNTVLLKGVVIGTRNANGGVGTTDLAITFANDTTLDSAQQLLRNLKFRTVAGAAGSRTIAASWSDSHGSSSNTLSRTIQVQA